jgi:hypothetical protein
MDAQEGRNKDEGIRRLSVRPADCGLVLKSAGASMQLTIDQFKTQLAELLRDLMPCTSADLTDNAIAYWDGRKVVYCYLKDDSDLIDKEFELDNRLWKDWEEYLSEWMVEPTFSVRPELQDRLNQAPTNGPR